MHTECNVCPSDVRYDDDDVVVMMFHIFFSANCVYVRVVDARLQFKNQSQQSKSSTINQRSTINNQRSADHPGRSDIPDNETGYFCIHDAIAKGNYFIILGRRDRMAATDQVYQ